MEDNRGRILQVGTWLVASVLTLVAILLSVALLRESPRMREPGTPGQSLEDSDRFDHFVSKIGFEIDYPKGWQINEVKGVDASLGGVEFFPPGEVESSWKPGRSVRDKEIGSHLISVGGASPYTLTYEEAEKYLFDEKNFRKLVLDDVRDVKILSMKKITVDSKPAHALTYTDQDGLKVTTVMLLAKPPRTPAPPLILSVSYRAKGDRYLQVIADHVIRSFRENSILSYYDREAEGRGTEVRDFIARYGDARPTFVPPGCVFSDRSVSKLAASSRATLVDACACPKKEFGGAIFVKKTPLALAEKLALTSGGFDIAGKSVDIGGRQGFLGYSRVIWRTDAFQVEIDASECRDFSDDLLLQVARSIK